MACKKRFLTKASITQCLKKHFYSTWLTWLWLGEVRPKCSWKSGFCFQRQVSGICTSISTQTDVLVLSRFRSVRSSWVENWAESPAKSGKCPRKCAGQCPAKGCPAGVLSPQVENQESNRKKNVRNEKLVTYFFKAKLSPCRTFPTANNLGF